MENGFVYIMALLFAIAFSSFAAYDAERTRAARTALGVILLAALATLFVNTLGDLGNTSFTDFPQYSTPKEESLIEKGTQEAFVRGIEQAIVQKFSLLEDDVTVTCAGFDFESARAQKIEVLLSGKAAFADIRAVREYVEKFRLGECEVTVLFE